VHKESGIHGDNRSRKPCQGKTWGFDSFALRKTWRDRL